MFKENRNHVETDLFAYEPVNSLELLKRLEGTEEYAFYELVFSQLDETVFAPLYCDDNGRSNAPVNSMVCSLILKEKKNMAFKEMFKQLQFNLAFRVAVGKFDLGKEPFKPSTFFKFLERLSDYYVKHGVDLIEEAFKKLTKKQLKQLEIKTGIVRADSLLVQSNIRSYSRLQLLLEVLLRFYRIFSDTDKAKFDCFYDCYSKESSEKYMYRLQKTDYSKENVKITEAYAWIKANLLSNYEGTLEYNLFLRVYNEQFCQKVDSTLELKPPQEVGSGCLQSPDDVDATYRKKREQTCKGFVINVTETCHPENKINLIVDVSAHPNNVNDSDILTERSESIFEMAPDVEEIHTDAAYGSKKNDAIFEEKQVIHVQTAIKGKKTEDEVDISQDDSGNYEVTCPQGHKAEIEKTKKKYKATFTKCADCPQQDTCPLIKRKKGRVFYFDHDYYLMKKRHKQLQKIPESHRSLRPNVEATVHEICDKTKAHKLKVRGLFKTGLFARFTAFGINFGRIYRYIDKKYGEGFSILFVYRLILIKILSFREKSTNLRFSNPFSLSF